MWPFTRNNSKLAALQEQNALLQAQNEQLRSWGSGDPALVKMFGFSPSLAGVSVTRQTALSIPAVWGAVDVVSKTLASLPFDLYQKTPDGARIASSHPNYYITKHEPSPYITGFNFRRALFASACFGDAFARIYRNGVGRVTRLVNLDSECVTPYITQDGDPLYYVNFHGKSEVLRPYDILHIKGLTLDGLIGENVVDCHKETFGVAIAATKFGAGFFGNGANVAAVVESGPGFTPDQVKRMEEVFNQRYAGPNNAGKTPWLDSGSKYVKVGLNPAEAAMNDTRTFQRREVATVFGIPLHLIQDLGDTTFNNVETMSTQFVTLCLRPWSVQTEQEFAVKTLTEQEKRAMEYFYRINLNGLLRGDTTARKELYKSGIETGWLMRNEARALEDLNAIEGLDKPMFPANMTILDENGIPEQVAKPPVNPAAGSQNDDQDNDSPQPTGQ